MTHGDATVITDERAADARYCKALRTRDRHRPPVAHGPHSQPPGPRPESAPVRGLLGRVALAEATDIFDGTDFYIGSRYHDGDGLVVFSWAAPIASTFFQSWKQHELCSQVTSRRTLLRRRGSQITDYVDDAGPAAGPLDPFAPRKLVIPKAPPRRSLPGRTIEQPSALIPEQRAEPISHLEPEQPTEHEPTAPAGAPEAPPMRAERAVLAAISAPRRERLTSVLATLQSDQYEMVTARSDRSLVVEGHPGTGKTVVAAHRAAYLVHPAHEPRPLGRVLVVGPTDNYVRHIRGVLDELAERADAIDALSLEDAMLDVRGISAQLDSTQPTDSREVDDELIHIAERAVHLLHEQGHLSELISHATSVEMAYEALRVNRVGSIQLSGDIGRATFLRSLPAFKAAQTMRRYLPILAACGAAVAGVGPYSYDHVVVDEAQDLSPLEWAVLRSLNPSGHWTLLGDLNQRRSDLSHADWSAVSASLAVDDMPVEALRRGYRTSAAIMAFASRLLPAGERPLQSLQTGGDKPRVRRTRAVDLYTQVATEASNLLERHTEGTVAIIGVNPPASVSALRQAGFHRDPHRPNTMTRADRQVRVLTPLEARGLEFDAAVVVEPTNFPKPFGRHGLLYTSLTRANRELVVLHSGQLQKELRDPALVAQKAVAPPVPRPEKVVPRRTARFLMIGSADWRESSAGREMKRFADETYGEPSDVTCFTVGDGRDLTPAERNALQSTLRDTSSANVLLVFASQPAPVGVRSVIEAAKLAGVQTWCWNAKLAFPIRTGQEEFVDFWWALIHKHVVRALADDAAVRSRIRGRRLESLLGEVESFTMAAKVPLSMRGSRPLRDLLGNAYHRRQVNRTVFRLVWAKVNGGGCSEIGTSGAGAGVAAAQAAGRAGSRRQPANDLLPPRQAPPGVPRRTR